MKWAPVLLLFTSVVFANGFTFPTTAKVHPMTHALAPLPCGALLAGRYLRVTATLQQRMAADFPETQNVRTVVYPFAGADGALAFALFGGAETVIAIDFNPFVKTADFNRQRFSAIANVGPDEGYSIWTDVLQEGHVGARMLGLLAHIYPQLRVHNFAVIEMPEEDATHGVITFDLGENTPLRTLVQLQTEVRNDFVDSWAMREIARLHPRAFLAKASMQHVPLFQQQAAPFVARLLTLLESNGGFLLEGADENRARRDAYEISHYFNVGTVRTPRRQYVLDTPWGYDRRAQVVSFP